MATLSELQTKVTRARAELAAKFDAFYRAVQDAAVGGVAEPKLATRRAARDAAQEKLDRAIAEVVAAGDPATLLAQVPADLAQLLLPVRLEARYVTTRHVTRMRSLDDVVDVSTLPVADALSNTGFHDACYELPALHTLPPAVQQEVQAAALRVRSKKWPLRQPDRDELWIRIYPDAVFTDAFEPDLQPREAEVGRAFWTSIWAKEAPLSAWERLVDATNPPRAAWIVRTLRPQNFTRGAPSGRAPKFPEVRLKDGPFTRAPVARLLPERFVVQLTRGTVVREIVGGTVPEPLQLGLDPIAAADDDDETSFTPSPTSINAPAALRWMHDVEAAEQVGLAIRVDLTQHPEFRDGVDSIVAVGVKLSAAPEEAQRLLRQHIENCAYKEQGLAILRQGTPTNRTADLTKREAAELESRQWFDAVWNSELEAATDGSRLRTAFGLPTDIPVPGGDGSDVDDALLVNAALWPATLGYFLLQFLTPALAEESRQDVRDFFTRHVSGRGLLPVLRIDRQPYGIVPTTSFEHWTYAPTASGEERFLAFLWQHLGALDVQWRALLPHVEAQARAANASHRLDEPFLKLLGLGASSLQLQRDVIVSADVRTALQHIQPTTATAFNEAGVDPMARMTELAAMRLSPTSYPTLVDSFASPPDRQHVRMPLVSPRRSETDELPRLPGKAWNYLDWLAGATLAKLWVGDLSEAPAGDGAAGTEATDAVLAQIARQATLRTFLETGARRIDADPARWLLRSRDFPLERLHDQPFTVTPQTLDTPLLAAYARIIEAFAITAPFTVEPDRWKELAPLASQLDKPGRNPELRPIAEHKTRLERMARMSTARLERAFAEHLDLCSHRLDAWLLGLVSQRFDRQRATRKDAIGIGAYGCLFEIVRSSAPAIRFVEVKPQRVPATEDAFVRAAIPVAHVAHAQSRGIDKQRMYFYLGEGSSSGALLDGNAFRAAAGTNSQQGHGYVHTPSPDHAAAAAVLYAGHVNEGSEQLLAIDLDSARARRALGVLDAIQEGSSLAELLGLALEREIHELGLDPNLRELRGAYPLRQRAGNDMGIHPLALTDGLAVLEASRRPQVPPVVSAVAPAIENVADLLDAASDLLLAESVFQSTKGSTERATAALRTLHAGGQVVAPEIVRSPTSGRSVHNRVAIMFERPTAKPRSPRAALAPNCDHWLAGQLPSADAIAVALTLPDGTAKKLTLADLELHPLDLVAATPETGTPPAESALAALIAIHARKQLLAGKHGTIVVDFASRRGMTKNELTVFDVAPLLAVARKLMSSCRPLTIVDLQMPGEPSTRPRIDTSGLSKQLTSLCAAKGALATVADKLRAAARAFAAKPGAPARGRLEAALASAWLHGAATALVGDLEVENEALVRRAVVAADDLDRRRAAGKAALAAISADTEDMARFERLADVVTSLFGATVRVFPEITIDKTDAFARGYADRKKLGGADPTAVERWLHEASLARSHVRLYRQLVLLREAFATDDASVEPTVVQLPEGSGKPHPWIGGAFDALQDSGTVSLVLELPARFAATGKATGILVDEWAELVPAQNATTGVAFHVEQPDSEPPQVMLLAVSPVENGHWQWQHLIGAVHEAIRLAKRRLVTPAIIEAHGGALSHVVPALLVPVAPGSTHVPTTELH